VGRFAQGVLPYPWPDQYAHHGALTCRGGGLVGIALGGCFTAQSNGTLAGSRIQKLDVGFVLQADK
jgi:hypothetical protein